MSQTYDETTNFCCVFAKELEENYKKKKKTLSLHMKCEGYSSAWNTRNSKFSWEFFFMKFRNEMKGKFGYKTEKILKQYYLENLREEKITIFSKLVTLVNLKTSIVRWFLCFPVKFCWFHWRFVKFSCQCQIKLDEARQKCSKNWSK